MQSGDFFGQYKILSKLGSGGMADVFRALDESGQEVAIKILSPVFVRDEEKISRFGKEIVAIKKLNHPGIVKIHDVGEVGENHYFTMDLLNKGDLRRKISNGLMASESVSIIRKIAEALAYLHGQGVVHRDIKPENILFDDSNNPVLTDLGIAKVVSSCTRLTNTGIGVGTPHYMSPEQARGVSDIDGRADLYSLGVVLYEMLTGKVPYDAENTVGVIMQHVEMPIPKLPGLLKACQPIIDQLLAKEPEDRFSSAMSFIDAIELIQTGDISNVSSCDIRGAEGLDDESHLKTTSCSVDAIDVNSIQKHKVNKKWGVAAMLAVVVLIGIGVFIILPEKPLEITAGPNNTGLDARLIKEKAIKESIDLDKIESEKSSPESSTLEQKTSDKVFSQEINKKETRKEIVTDNEIKGKDNIAIGTSSAIKGDDSNGKQHDIEKITKDSSNLVIPNEGSTYLSESEKPISYKAPILRLDSVPSGAHIFVNGREFGKTPYYGQDLANGKHTILLRHANYSDFETQIDLIPGVLLDKNIKMKKGVGKLILTINPPDSAVSIEGKNIECRRKCILNDLEAGEHFISVSKDGYYPQDKTIFVKINGSQEVNISLKGGDLIKYNGVWLSQKEYIEKLILKADKLFKQGALYSEGECAYKYYKEILKIDNNIEAKEGIKAIAKKFLEFAEYHLERSQFDSAAESLQSAIKIDPTLSGISSLHDNLLDRYTLSLMTSYKHNSFDDALKEAKKRFGENPYNKRSEDRSKLSRYISKVEIALAKGDWITADQNIEQAEHIAPGSKSLEEYRLRLAAEKNQFQPNRIIRDRLKDSTLGPRMLTIPFVKHEDSNGNKVESLFLMSETEITNEQYYKFLQSQKDSMDKKNIDKFWNQNNLSVRNFENTLSSNNISDERKNYPVTGLSLNEINHYLYWLSTETGKKYRLPNNAEWELAAGIKFGKFWWGNSQKNCSQSLANNDVMVGEKNQFGLIGVTSNVWEIIANCWNSESAVGYCDHYISRGGSYDISETGESNINREESDFMAISFCHSPIKTKRKVFRSSNSDRVGFRVLREM